MPTLRSILKYTPATVLGLLVVAWMLSLFVTAGFAINSKGFVFAGSVFPSRFQILWGQSAEPSGWGGSLIEPAYSLSWLIGRFDFVDEVHSPFAARHYTALVVPLPLIITFLVPLAVGPFLTFRFRLWHYLVYTALIALELAYYLRWQE